MIIAFTLCSNNYLAQAKTLADSYVLHNPNSKFIIGLVDKMHSEVDYSFFRPHEIVEFTEIGLDDCQEMIDKYNIVEFNTAVKPFYFNYLFKRFPTVEKAYYIDPDIAVFDSFNDLNEELDRNDFLLTPHLLDPVLTVDPYEILVLRVGIYNLGFLGVKNCENVLHFMDWWENRLNDHCYMDPAGKGLFVDQLWVNYLPVFYDRVKILKKYGYNIGYWNFHERKVEKKGSDFFVNGDKLSFFHFSSYNPLTPDTLCHRLNYSFETRPDLVELFDGYTKELLRNNYSMLSKIPSVLSFKPMYVPQDNITVLSKLKRKVSSSIKGILK